MTAAGKNGAGRVFELVGVGRIVFGSGAVERMGPIASAMGRLALVVTNAGPAGAGGATDAVTRELVEHGVNCAIFVQHREPTVDDVDAALQTARRGRCDVVVGLGGGSAIDCAKAVAALMTNGGSALDYMEVVGKGLKLRRPSAPWIAVPTTSGTGAEVTRNAVIACPDRNFKASIRGEGLLASAAVVDPMLGLGVPAAVTACSGMDALCQLIESYTSTGAQPITDALAAEGIPRAARSLERAVKNGSDLPAREDMALAALLSGITLTNAGLGAVHGFAAPMGANFPAPHGAICAALLPGVMAANVRALRAADAKHPVLARYARGGRLLTGRARLGDRAAIDAGVRFVADLAAAIGIPPLSKFGVTIDRAPEMVALAKKASSMRYNPVELSDEELIEILTEAVTGR
jgi:alcohol dehydrogenase class IV